MGVGWAEVTRRLECFWVGGSGSRLLTTWASPHGMDTLPPEDPGTREKPIVFQVLAQRVEGTAHGSGGEAIWEAGYGGQRLTGTRFNLMSI